jgi:hypothetical protein
VIALALILASAFVVGVGLNAAQWRWSDPGVQAFLLLSVSVILRPLVLVLGLDEPFPEAFFRPDALDGLVGRVQLLVLVWLVVFVATRHLFQSTRPPRPRAIAALTDNTTATVAVVLATIGLVLAVPLWARYGGPLGLAKAAKSRGVDSYKARGPAQVAAYLGAAVYMRGRHMANHRWKSQGALAYLLGAGVSFTWGARDAAVFPLALVIFMGNRRPGPVTTATMKRALRRSPRIVLAIVLMVGVGIGLRTQRDAAFGGKFSSLTGRSIVRQASVAMNNTQFDALMLAVRDAHQGVDRPGLPFVISAAQAALPSPLRAPDYSFTPPAVAVAQRYVPTRKNGWPLTALGDWHFALGLAGVVLGAMLSGMLVCWLDRWSRDQPEGATACTVALVWLCGSSIAQGGVWLTTPGRALVLAPIAIVLGIGRALRSEADSAEAPNWSVPVR